MSRGIKRLIVILVYVLIIGGVGFLIYDSQYGPTCFDHKQNGKEEGIDCGTLACGFVCAPTIQALEVQPGQLVKTPAGDYDFVAQIYNPNIEYGVVHGSYVLMLRGSGGTTTTGQFYLLPGQTKSLVLTALKNVSDDTLPELQVKDVEWEKVTGTVEMPLITAKDHFTTNDKESVFETTVVNNSDYDFDTVDVDIIVTDNTGNLLATSVTKVKTLLSQSERYIKVSWPFALPVDARVSAEASTNMFNNANFIKQHGTQEKFQQYF